MQHNHLTLLRFLSSLLFTLFVSLVVLPQPAPAQEPSISDSDRWHRLDTTGGGKQTAIATHPANPDIVYISSDNGGLFKTTNGGDSWFSISSNLGAYRLGFVILDPLNPEVVYVIASNDFGTVMSGGTEGEIHRSLNGGLSWEFISDDMGFQNSFPNQTSIVIPYDSTDPGRFDQNGNGLSDVILVGSWGSVVDPPKSGIWRSQDEGKTFTHLALEDKNITAIRSFPGEVNMVFATTYEGDVYRSQDLGMSWQDVTGNMPLAHPVDLAIHPTNKDILYVTCRWCRTDQPPVWKTTDGGQNWEAASTGLNPSDIGGFPRILMDRFDPNVLYVTTEKAAEKKAGVYRSTDGGNSWNLMPARLVLPDGRPYFWYQFQGELAIGQAVDGRLFATDEGAWRYPAGDGQEEWEPATIGIGNIHVNTIEVDPLNPSVLYQGISDFGPYKSVDRGLSFHRTLGNGWPVMVDNYVWNGPYYSNYRYCQLGCSATCQAKTPGIAAGGTTDFAISKQDSNVIYSAFGSGSGESIRGGVNKSTDGGKTWQPVGFQLENGFELNPETCVPYGFRYLAIDPTNDDLVFAVMDIPSAKISKLYKTTDGGATWSEVYSTPNNIYIRGIEVSPIESNLVIFTTNTDVYQSKRGGEAGSWQVITPPEALFGLREVSLSPHKAGVYVVGSNDQGIFYTADGGISWENNQLKDWFAQKMYQGSDQYLPAETATAINPNEYVLKNISAVVFDPVRSDTFYVAGTQYTRASFGAAKITNASQNWERLPLEGLSHRNVFDLAVDPQGENLYAATFDGTFKFQLGPSDLPPQPTNEPSTPVPVDTPTITPEPTETPSPELTPEPVSLTLDIPPVVKVNEIFNVDVVAENVSATGLYGAQFEISFDPELISVSNLVVNPNLSFVVLNEVDHANGKITLVASQQGKVPGLTDDVVLLNFEATAGGSPGVATFSFENAKFSNAMAQGFDINTQDYSLTVEQNSTPVPTSEPPPTSTPEPTPEPTQVPTAEPTSQPTPEPTQVPTQVPTVVPTVEPTSEPTVVPTSEPTPVSADVTGQVILAGRSNENWSGATVAMNSGEYGVTGITGDYNVAGVSPGIARSITADAPGYLSAICTNVAVVAPQTRLASITLLGGDINNDDVIDIVDATAVGAGFGQSGTNLPADITADGTVDIFDIVLVSVNYNEQGPQNWTCN